MTDPVSPAPSSPSQSGGRTERIGTLMVFLSALFWSFGGAIARWIEAGDSWTLVFWRSFWAAAFLLSFMIWRDGLAGAIKLFRGMGKPGLAVACCFATSSGTFVIALSYTTVANVVLMQASVPLLAALLSWIFLRERVSVATWIAIAVVICGVIVMVSASFDGTVSPVGDGLALLIAIGFSTATVITRRYSHVRMTPATCLGVTMAALVASTQASTLSVSAPDMGKLLLFGAVNLGLGMALFTTGARLIPAAFAALLGTFETILAPVWVWLVHGEVPPIQTLVGGGIIFAALLVHITMEFRRQAKLATAMQIGANLPI
jgi:drug/metabolite transporter (DMT)-like permease